MDPARLKNQLLAKLFTRFPALSRRLIAGVKAGPVGEGAWTEMGKSLSQCMVSLVTTGGVHVNGQAPFDMSDPDGDPTYRAIPSDIDAKRLVITHDYYDHRDAEKDINIIFPIDRLRELVEEKTLGGLSPTFYGFMGHIQGEHVKTLIREIAPEVGKKMKEEGVDVALLTPG